MQTAQNTAAKVLQRTSRKRRAPADSPASALYAAVSVRGKPSLPDMAKSNLAKLSEKQCKTFLGEAAKRIKAEANTRAGKWLRNLDRLHKSGRRTRQESWDKLAAIIEPMLARLDMATMVLGWLDNEGQFRLNLQNRIAVDSNLKQCALSRLLKLLSEARYIRRVHKRLYQDGKRWITRTMIVLRPRFFIELGLAHQLAQARTRKKEKRRAKLAKIARRQNQQALQELADNQARVVRKRSFQARERIAAERALDEQQQQTRRNQAADLAEFAKQHKHLEYSDVIRLWKSLNQA
ncbi:hypothetical protein [Pseudomonas sp. WAC2]|uniref:hypothetical protein n=1 Tax=Pseudomonas sp. WAC2 TaxID=3055057 RepID=UPI0025AED042|nr:hypothetical protein [Pseudomonas sp. WAC2]MDN3238063.1 hypothetical protein [Pseudomonas sp. WAC2]